MATLNFLDQNTLEKILGMDTGFVLNFSDRTFQNFIIDSVRKDIDDIKYHRDGRSKSKRLRVFWNLEPNHIVAKLISDLLIYQEKWKLPPRDQSLIAECKEIVSRLKDGVDNHVIDTFTGDVGEQDFETVAKAVRDAIEQNKPQEGLDRLHTFVVKYLRMLCAKHNLSADRDIPLNGLVGAYVKHQKQAGRIESEMTERILKSSIATLEAFNHVRNTRSLAHDNPLLSYQESTLIVSHIAGLIKFMKAIEEMAQVPMQKTVTVEDEDIPF